MKIRIFHHISLIFSDAHPLFFTLAITFKFLPHQSLKIKHVHE
ncbi:hypothetical protein MtrunA17_Chr1g0194411 [Medicago truncatula]|uniref:Transmembrane protein n=1 Tax=Medicago truncatula TaxID=3880 RepID=A0A396JRS9_MEDTR|nr:hypothetical protein MtrunA17_Chr1g0194411 [Medicago truncatula]